MMKRLFLGLVLVGGLARAEFLDGNELLLRLSSEDSGRRSVALGYVMGVFDTMHNVNHCAPTNVTGGQVRDIVRNYISNTPAKRHLTGDTLTLEALAIAFPCANKPRGNGSGGKSL